MQESLGNDFEETPSSKITKKRAAEKEDGMTLFDDNGTQASSNKMPKLANIKQEPKD